MSVYYPSKQELAALREENKKNQKHALSIPETFLQIMPGKLARTDGLSLRAQDKLLAKVRKMAEKAKDPKTKRNLEALVSRTESVSDVSENLYNRFAQNPESIHYWFPALFDALKKQKEKIFTVPDTQIWRLPIELAQFIRIEYQNTTQSSRDLFNKIIFDAFKLEDGKTYFIKTGEFSSKFEFHNAKCSEPREMGEYFQVINNFAMMVGAGRTIDLCVREYIPDVENNPTIYNGMPLHTEYRCFVDFDSNKILGIVNYWHPIVMKRALNRSVARIANKDYETYVAHQDVMIERYNAHLSDVIKGLRDLIPNIDLKGQWSLDLMLNGDKLYAIDMARMSESALAEYAHTPAGDTDPDHFPVVIGNEKSAY